ncbi:MAG TPA: endolytic transglycosylase MltG [Candidatus Saccharimonas sp.]|nr:endolytic transglycosylase MltG [Candidatus Saccharimonas sp.]
MNDILPPRRKPPQSPQGVNLPQNIPEFAPPIQLPHIDATPPKKQKPRIKWWLVVIAAVILTLVATVAGAYFWYKDALKPVSTAQNHVSLTVNQGATIDQVITLLQQKNLIKNALALQIFVKFHGLTTVKTGIYAFSPSQPPEEILAWLEQGKVDTFKVTILPGKTLVELKKIFMADGFTSQQVDDAYAHAYDNPLLADKPATASLEGYLYPDTFFATSQTSLEGIFAQSFDEFEKKLENTGLKQKLSQKGFSVFQGITLASIVEQEVSNAADRRQVAQVFELRLQQGVTLGSDVTYHYAAALLGVAPSPTLDSPYNTRLYKGLPPGPIGNFSFDALQAVADPAPGDYLFFVAGDDGMTHFAHTDQEHQSNIANYCQKLCASN